MKTAMLGLLAESPVHPGTGRGKGVVDLPVAREAATDYPVLVGSSLKGALRDKFEAGRKTQGAGESDIRESAAGPFGKPDAAGGLMISDARLLLLPVRSLTESYRWATCPHLIERFRRDLARAGVVSRPEIPTVERGEALGSVSAGRAGGYRTDREWMFLEERQFRVADAPQDSLVDAIKNLILHEGTRARVASRLAVIHDHDFSWFARYGLAVQARNVLADGTKRSVNLWYEETLPPDTVMYALIAARDDDSLGTLQELFPATDPYLQAGGNETVGQGWFAVTVVGSERRGP